ncbi:MAG: transcriptional regulator, LuxR family [Alphaproteobacteria bacterium]|jgi:DNA-binding CsgD family transcriptional regulator|nr:transcriptional regulator, LuxR family [Alphaproteobacteria bacterium]
MMIEEFISASNRAATTAQLFGIFRRAMSFRGFDHVVFSLLTDHPVIGRPAQHAIFCTYPEAWMQHYNTRNYEAIDPVRNHLPATDEAFLWDSLRGNLTQEQDTCMREADAAGLKKGIAIPLHGQRGMLAGIGAASSHGQADMQRDNLVQVQVISRQFYNCYLMLEKRSITSQRQCILTRRERDVADLYWRGHKRVAVAAALGITENSIKFHLRNFRLKMGAPTLRGALMKALRLGIIGR